jgi:tetratricopeptide (TPR) repeat protein
MTKNKINIKFKNAPKLSSKITFNDVTYFINTEEKGENSSQICSRVYLKGKILFSKDADISHLIGSHNFQEKLNDFMEETQKSVVDQFTKTLEKNHKKNYEYLEEIRSLIRVGKRKNAFQLIKEGLEVYPDDLLLLSYYGFLCSQVTGEHSRGIKICRDTISKIDSRKLKNREQLYPIFYLNLGRAYLGAKKRKEAFMAFNIGLKSDPENAAINAEIDKLGRRKAPVLPLFKRNHPLNKSLGLLKRRIGTSRH